MENNAVIEPSTFTLFSRLPADIRQQIWRIACSQPAHAPSICFFPERTPGDANANNPNLTVQEPANINILATNTEAHDIALVSPAITRPYNPARDILFLPPQSFHHFTSTLCGFGGPTWVTEIHHLALGLSLTHRGLWLPLALARLASLQTLSVVYPAASGTFAFNADVDPHPQISAGSDNNPNPSPNPNPTSNTLLRLQRLTPADLESLTIEADYMYDTWAGAFQVRWMKSGRNHMEMVEREIDEQCRPENAGDQMLSPLWDHAAQRVRIRYVARVFVRGVGRGRFAG